MTRVKGSYRHQCCLSPCLWGFHVAHGRLRASERGLGCWCGLGTISSEGVKGTLEMGWSGCGQEAGAPRRGPEQPCY